MAASIAVMAVNKVANMAAGKATEAIVGSWAGMDKQAGILAKDILHIKADVVAVGIEAEGASSEGQKLQMRSAIKIQAV